MLVLGLILLIIGWLIALPVLVWIGVLLLVVGALFALLGAMGNGVGGRSHWW